MPSAATTPTSRSRSAAATRSAQPASASSATAEEGGAPPLPRLDGRRVHIVDRALDYAALAAGGLSAARIARKRRRSAGYVSILLRLGQAIATMEPAELAALRSPRVTWKLAQRIVRTDVDVGSIRHQLRLAVGGFSTHNVDRRKHRVGRAGVGRTGGNGGGGSDAPSSARAGGTAGRAGAAWGWDESWFTRDPADYVRHHLAHLAAVHRSVEGRAQRAVALTAARRLSVGQSLAALQRSLAASQGEAPQGAAARAVAALAILERHIERAREEIESVLEEGGVRAPEGRAPGGPPAVRPPRARVVPASPAEVDEDLE